MTRTRMSLLLTGGLLIGLTACGSTDTTTVSSIAPETTVAPAADPVSTTTGPTTTPAATTASTVVASASSVAVNSAKPSTTSVTTASTVATTAASKPDLSAVLALVDSAEQSGAGADKELNTANNAMNSTEQDPQS